MLHILRTVPEFTTPTLNFSQRGKEVFMLIREGLTNKQVGKRLGMGVNGVKRHKERMLLENKCATMLELIAKYHGMSSGAISETNHPQD